MSFCADSLAHHRRRGGLRRGRLHNFIHPAVLPVQSDLDCCWPLLVVVGAVLDESVEELVVAEGGAEARAQRTGQLGLCVPLELVDQRQVAPQVEHFQVVAVQSANRVPDVSVREGFFHQAQRDSAFPGQPRQVVVETGEVLPREDLSHYVLHLAHLDQEDRVEVQFGLLVLGGPHEDLQRDGVVGLWVGQGDFGVFDGSVDGGIGLEAVLPEGFAVDFEESDLALQAFGVGGVDGLGLLLAQGDFEFVGVAEMPVEPDWLLLHLAEDGLLPQHAERTQCSVWVEVEK